MPQTAIKPLKEAIDHLTGDAVSPEAFAKVAAWGTNQWRRALVDIPTDDQTYEDQHGRRRTDDAARLYRWWNDASPPVAEVDWKLRGFLGFHLLTLAAIQCSNEMRFRGTPPGKLDLAGVPADRLCATLVADVHVRQAIRELYRPPRSGGSLEVAGGEDPAALATKLWSSIDFETLTFHRNGTTSFILKGQLRDSLRGRLSPIALKCLIYPYQEIPAIANATRDYRSAHTLSASEPHETSHLVAVTASSDNWVLMEFVQGKTIGEVLEEDPPPKVKREIMRPLDLDRLERLGKPLLNALAQLEVLERHHGDLSPSNIIVEADKDGVPLRVRLIDLGVNYLHTRSLAWLPQADIAYVAPEVPDKGKSDERADLYSLGMLLIAISGIPHNADGTVPDAFYQQSVGLARLLEDLVDKQPERRLLVAGIDPDEKSYPLILGVFERELEVAKAIREADKTKGPIERLKRLLPREGAVNRQREILKIRSGQAKAVQGGRSFPLRQARRLNRWAVANSWLVWVCFAISLMWLSRDVDFGWQAKWIELVNNTIGRDRDGVLFLDDIRAADYPVEGGWGNLPVRIVGISFLLTGAKYYLNVLAELSPLSSQRGVRRGRAQAATWFNEITMRAMAFVPVIYVMVPTLMQRDWWPLFTALGVATVAIANTSCLWFARNSFERARRIGLSTVPKGEIPSLEKFAPWTPSSWFYCVPVWMIGTLLLLDAVQDELVYACFVTLINMGMWYVVKCGVEAPYVRVCLTRATLAAERLDFIEVARRKAIATQRDANQTPKAAGLAAQPGRREGRGPVVPT